MSDTIDPAIYRSVGNCLINGDVSGAMEIIAAQTGLQDLYEQYADIFLRENYIRYDVPYHLNALLLAYQQYFRDVFYLKLQESTAEKQLFARLQNLLNTADGDAVSIGKAVEAAFQAAGYHALSGKTNGYFGPYIWKTTLPVIYTVKLPDTDCRYTVNILKDFIFRSWMDYLTFGTRGTGGWVSPDGTVNCAENAYDFESEQFKVSLLKHEAQHVRDLERFPRMEAWELEYRAKLVELIYTEQADLLAKFSDEAIADRKQDSHAVAACRIIKEMGDYKGREIPAIQQKAAELFRQSNIDVKCKYR